MTIPFPDDGVLKPLISKAHIVRFPSDKSLFDIPPACRVCGSPLYLSGHFLVKADNHQGPPAGEIVVCINCGWTWWVVP